MLGITKTNLPLDAKASMRIRETLRRHADGKFTPLEIRADQRLKRAAKKFSVKWTY